MVIERISTEVEKPSKLPGILHDLTFSSVEMKQIV
jgi:hypothetical protein